MAISGIISEGVKNLKRNKRCGIKDIDKIIYTFETAKKICEGELIYLPSKSFTWAKYKRMKRISDKIRKKYKLKYRPMTKRESIRLEEGFDIFKDQYFKLWN